jgi:hypothetical protein
MSSCYIPVKIMDQITPHNDPTLGDVPTPISGALRMLLAATAGTLASVLLFLISPAPIRPSVLQSDPYRDMPGLIGQILRLEQLIYSSPYFVLPVVMVFGFLAITRRDQKKSWIYAFLVGYSLPSLLFHFVFHWI